jgi:hypothetical protein
MRIVLHWINRLSTQSHWFFDTMCVLGGCGENCDYTSYASRPPPANVNTTNDQRTEHGVEWKTHCSRQTPPQCTHRELAYGR